jgi:hypothetical protein
MSRVMESEEKEGTLSPNRKRTDSSMGGSLDGCLAAEVFSGNFEEFAVSSPYWE